MYLYMCKIGPNDNIINRCYVVGRGGQIVRKIGVGRQGSMMVCYIRCDSLSFIIQYMCMGCVCNIAGLHDKFLQ